MKLPILDTSSFEPTSILLANGMTFFFEEVDIMSNKDPTLNQSLS
jgi:hypothetical protein